MKKIFLIFTFSLILFTNFISVVSAQNIFGISDPPGCESKDTFLPNLIICGRNPVSAGTCTDYTKECTLGDLINTGSRALVFLLSLALLIVPLIIMYYGAMIIINKNFDPNIDLIKKYKGKIVMTIFYFILMLSAWLIVRTVVDIFQVDTRINTFLLDENGNRIQARPFIND